MKCLQLLLMCWCSSIPTMTSHTAVTARLSGRVSRHSCVTAYWNTVNCVLNITDNPVGSSAYTLKFTHSDSQRHYSCPLVMMNHNYNCDCKITDKEFADHDEYKIELCDESDCHTVETIFVPSENVQLTPPHIAEVQETPDNVSITWKSGYEAHLYLNNVIDYELRFQTPQGKVTNILPLRQGDSISVQKSQLKPDATCIQVRSIPKPLTDYKAIWSEWSPLTCWKSNTEGEQDNKLLILIKFLGPVCVAFGVLLIVFYSPAARMKIKTLSHTPSPAPFFRPLFQQHEGNLQEWLTPKGKFVLTYKPEEMLMTDTVIVMPKSVAKGPEGNRDLHNPSVTQLTFTQCQTSYVGLPGIHEVSPPLTMICTAGTSYTQLPFTVCGVGSEEAEVVPSPPKDLFNISQADSGCSCEDLSQSLECEEPNSPVVDSPPLCSCTDYCILNKTAEGFAPVLVSKGGSLNASPDSLQEGKS